MMTVKLWAMVISCIKWLNINKKMIKMVKIKGKAS